MTAPAPRWLPAQDAARYLGMETEGFRRAVRQGKFPPPTRHLGPQSPRWDRLALDKAMGASDASGGMEDAVNALVAERQAKAQASRGPQDARGRNGARVSV